MPTRINKYLADHNYASRREADKLIAAGHVLINGRVAKLGEIVSESDRVEIEAKSYKLKAESYQYLAYHKPRGLATEDIKTPAGTFPLGRLDKDSAGLILITNDGRLTGRLLGPESKHEKEYIVTVDKKIDGLDLRRMSAGMEIEGIKTRPAKTEKINDDTFRITLTEGKKHQIRRMGAGLGYQVRELKRVRILNIHLGNLPPGQFRPLSGKELEQLMETLGLNQSRSED